MSLATAEAIRDRIYALVEGIAPTSLSADKFRRYRNEGGADFDAWAEKIGDAAFRRVQVRQRLTEDLPETTNVLEERVRIAFEMRIGYPQTHRYGPANAMDRDDIINQDWLKINEAVGIYGAGNFSGSHDCIPLGAIPSRDQANKVDILVIEVEVEFLRSVSA